MSSYIFLNIAGTFNFSLIGNIYMNKIFQTHKNIKFICIGIMLSIISIVRYGFAVNIGNDNEFILPFLINPESLNTLNQDLIFQSGYSDRTFFFDFLKPIFINHDLLKSSLIVYLVFLNIWFYVWHHIFYRLKIKNPYAYLFFIILISSPYLFTYSGPVLYDQYLTPRFLSLLIVSIAFLAYLRNKANLSCFIIGIGLLFHIPTALPAAVLVLLTEIVNNKITRKIFHHIFLIFIPLTFFYFYNFEKLDKEFYLFTATPLWFAEVENRIPYLFIKNFDIEQIIIIFGWFILIPTIILKSFTKERYKNLSYIVFLPITYLIVGQISIDLFKFPIAMILQSSKFINIFIIPLSLLLLICLDKKPITNFSWILLLLSLIYRNEYLPFIVLFIIYFDIHYKLSRKTLCKLVILTSTFLSSFSINIKYYNSEFLTYILTGWMHPHYGLRIEPVIWRSKSFLGNLDMWQSPSYSNDRLNLLTYIKKNTKINELTLISNTVIDDFNDF